jgi:tetratricopeptide (TPR) repeat protein
MRSNKLQVFALPVLESNASTTRMKKKLLWLTLTVALSARVLSAAQAHLHSDPNAKLGTVSFPISCSSAAQQAIEHGLALQHSFLFDEAEKQFHEATEKDPACAMAYWAEALGLYRPLAYRSTDSDMQQGWQWVRKAQALHAKTQRERDYIDALAVFYREDQNNAKRDGDKQSYETRNREFSQALGKIYQQYPEDHEAAVFYAMSLLTWGPDAEHPLINPQKAIAILNQVFHENPDHPGVAHYLIHAADAPQLAPLGLEAARRYAQIAPAAPHALHMPSHIFARLGLWQEDIQSNLASLAAARHPAGMHVGAENQVHAMEFLEYAYLQIGEDQQAAEMVRQQAVIGYDQVDKNLVDYLNRTRANSPAMYDLETRHWKEVTALQPDLKAESYNQAITYWTHAVAAGHLRDAAAARDAVNHNDAMIEETKRGPHAFRAEYMTTKRDEARAWLAFAEGKNDEAIQLLRAVAAKQDIEGKGEVELPAREMLADMLLEMGRPQDALIEYENSMKVDPNRFNGIYGAARAAELTHQVEKAATYYAQLLKNCDNGTHSDRSELAQARAFVTKK